MNAVTAFDAAVKRSPDSIVEVLRKPSERRRTSQINGWSPRASIVGVTLTSKCLNVWVEVFIMLGV